MFKRRLARLKRESPFGSGGGGGVSGIIHTGEARIVKLFQHTATPLYAPSGFIPPLRRDRVSLYHT
jgi:hypothetical protein